MLENLEGFTGCRIETNPYASITQGSHLDIVLSWLEEICRIIGLVAAFPSLHPSLSFHLEGFLKHKER